LEENTKINGDDVVVDDDGGIDDDDDDDDDDKLCLFRLNCLGIASRPQEISRNGCKDCGNRYFM